VQGFGAVTNYGVNARVPVQIASSDPPSSSTSNYHTTYHDGRAFACQASVGSVLAVVVAVVLYLSLGSSAQCRDSFFPIVFPQCDHGWHKSSRQTGFRKKAIIRA
jgi:hypothetical protein